jgi:hypothetical protein
MKEKKNKLEKALKFLTTLRGEEIKEQFEKSYNKYKDIEYQEVKLGCERR